MVYGYPVNSSGWSVVLGAAISLFSGLALGFSNDWLRSRGQLAT